MGCAASTQAGGSAARDTKQGAGLQFTNATAEKEDDEPSQRSVREIDTAAIEVQSHLNGEQSLLALAMSAAPDADIHRHASTLKVSGGVDGGARRPHSSEMDAAFLHHQGAKSDASAVAAPLAAVTNPIKIRIQEPLSAAITTEEHEHATLLPDITYSMRSAATGTQSATSDASQFGFSAQPSSTSAIASAAVIATTLPVSAVRKLQPIASSTSSTGNGVLDPHIDQLHAAGAFAPWSQPQLQHHQQLSHVPVGATAAAIDRPFVPPHVAMGRGISVPEAHMTPSRGGGRGAGRGFAGPISPLFRGPTIPIAQSLIPSTAVHSGGRGAVVAGPRGLPRPLLVIPGRGGGSQWGQRPPETLSPQSHHQPVPVHVAPLSESMQPIANGVRSRMAKSNSDNDDDDDDDDDLVGDDDEVGDWDLEGDDDAAAAVAPKPIEKNSPVSSRATGHQVPSPDKSLLHSIATSSSSSVHRPSDTSTLLKERQQSPAPIRVTKAPPHPAASPQRAPKFRPAFDNIDDISSIVPGASQVVSSDDDDDDDDSNFGDSTEDVEDWFKADSDVAAASVHPSSGTPTAAHAKKQLPPCGRVERTVTSAALAPTSPIAALHVTVPATTPTFRHAPALDAPKPSPHPPPIQRLPSRQIVAPGSLSPTKQGGAIGSPLGATSPLKQVSYKSNIVGAGQPALMPMALNPLTSASGAKDPAVSAPIRDTKVVKKKRAELPQRNLPHPTPKFGDWLNSRTMINNYIILESLGSGSYAEVKLCKEKVSGKLFAMKFINRDIMKKDKLGKQSKLDDIKREIAIMKKLNHPNVLRLYEVMDDPNMNKLFLVLEYMKHGDLLSHQKKKHVSGAMESLHDRDLHCVFLQVVLGLAYLHEQKIVHGDIKPQNILVGDKDAVKIADFGISQSLYGSKQKLSDTAGTPAFMSPEMCSGEEYSGQMADIWAVGATIFMLKFGSPPFIAKSAMQMFEKIQHDALVFPGPIDPLLQDLLAGMMVKDPQQRMTLAEVMAHPWVTKEETLSSYVSLHRQDVPRITVSSDEIEHAIHTKDQFAVIVNIRIQMMKKLQKARHTMLARQQRLGDADSSSADCDDLSHTQDGRGTDGIATLPAIVGVAHEHADPSDAVLVGVTSTDLQRKTAKVKSPMLKQNKVHAAAAPHQSEDIHENQTQRSTGDHGGGKPDAPRESTSSDVPHDMLSNEEIHYRAQMFSRKKTGSTATSTSKSRDQGACGFENDADASSSSRQGSGRDSGDDDSDDEGEDDDALSTDDDDEAAVAQSPQLLDELLLTTLSLPPLTKTKSPTDDLSHERATHTSGINGVSLGAQGTSPPLQQQQIAPVTGDAKETFYGESATLALRFGVASLQGRRNTQEDRWVALPQIKDAGAPQWASSAFVGLYDGHGGEECANILHEQLHAWILRDPHACTLTVSGLQTCFEELDTYVCDYLLQQGDLSGSTATCVLFQPSSDGTTIRCLTAHVGDCRLVLSLRGTSEVREITQDHRLTVAAERDRILASGGRVVNNRVNGVMAITRAFGDLEFKGRLGRLGNSASALALPIPDAVQQNPFQREDENIPALLTARPDVHEFVLDAHTHEFLLLACDGLWDVMTSDEAAEIFRDRLHFHANVQLAAKELAQEAIRRYSNDNITVVAIQVVR